jgi:anthranilate/para-aminobenzoate synthase component II
MPHTFHIPVLGLGYSIDTPVKVAKYGISSVASIVDDELIERMRAHYVRMRGETYAPITKKDPDYRAKRITAYLDLMHGIIQESLRELQQQPFGEDNDIARYFRLLPPWSSLKQRYDAMLNMPEGVEKMQEEEALRGSIVSGAIDVNIMSKVDKMNVDAAGNVSGDIYSDALAVLRGFAWSKLSSSIIMSAGMNPRLYSYLENFPDFYPDSTGTMRKKVTLKVSDYRSALVQAKFLAKKGIWVSEFRIESGLNCGGHAFATEGNLLGPVLEEFKCRRDEMFTELLAMYSVALKNKGIALQNAPATRITVQGGIGTAAENSFLLDHYGLEATGWGSPFLLVPEVTNVDDETLHKLANASGDAYYVSDSSPLGVLFNNFKNSTAEKQRLERIAKGRPGSPCNKRYLVSNTEFTAEPICTASRQYQQLKIKQLSELEPRPADLDRQLEAVTEKLCLCDGLSTAALIKNHLVKPRENKAVAICPGPNLAWFSGIYSLDEMVGHIYGQVDLLAKTLRPNMFINELNLYVDYLKKDMERHTVVLNEKKAKYFAKFKENLFQGIRYYKNLIPEITNQTAAYREEMMAQLGAMEMELARI